MKGKSVAMLVHHSRNSQQKQWEETLVLALAGMSRLLRTHLPLIVNSSSFPQVPFHPSSPRPLLSPCPFPVDLKDDGGDEGEDREKTK